METWEMVLLIISWAVGLPIAIKTFVYLWKTRGEIESESDVMSRVLVSTIIGMRKQLIDREIKYLEDCGFSLAECEEHHFPGDCLLCGAQ